MKSSHHFFKKIFILDGNIINIDYESLEEFEKLTHNKPFPTDFEREKFST